MARDGRPARGREGRHHRRRPHLREEDLLRRRRPQRPDPGRRRRTRPRSRPACARSRPQLRRLETLGVPVVAAINGAALGGGLEIALASHHRIVVDDPKVQHRLPRGAARPAARRRRRRPHRAHARASSTRSCSSCCRASALQPAQGQGARPRRRDRRHAARTWSPPPRRGSPRNPRGRRQPWDVEGLQDPRRHAVEPGAGAEPAGVPGEPAQAAQGRELPGAAPHHGRGGRGRAGRLRHRVRDRGPLLRRPGRPARSRRT